MKGAVKYRGIWLMKGSVAFELYGSGEFKKLDAHLKELDKKAKDRGEKFPKDASA
jgi:hypothetical protein